MNSILLMPLVIPFTILNPLILIKLLLTSVNKRVNGENYAKEMFMMTVLLVSYIMFINLFY